jgi:carbon-monoxide dehydrogenase small subunit
MAIEVTLTVNGEEQSLRVEPFETLLSTLRERLQLTGAKRGCNQGVCGACSVMVGDRAVRACLSLAADCVDEPITTVEGLSTPWEMSTLQVALVEAGAIQCGFCTPGMVVSMTALLRANPCPSRDEVRAAASSNLCRCTGYQKIVEAVLSLTGKRTP